MVSGKPTMSRDLPFCLAALAYFVGVVTATQKPHILHIEVGDAGWSDIGWNSADFRTPFLDRLRRKGVDLPHFYALPKNLPSRIGLLTGKYPYTLGYIGMKGQYYRHSNFTLPLEHKLLPEYLQDRGYSTHLSGHWSMGFCNDSYMPQQRGFETFYGSLASYRDHYNHTDTDFSGYDFRNGCGVLRSAQGQYSTTLFSDRVVDIVTNHSCRNDQRPLYILLAFSAPRKPLQAPQEFIDKCSHIADSDRKLRCAMMAAVDDGVKKVVDAFRDAELFDDLLIVFHSTSGGPQNWGARNYPLRGRKATVYEGGTRVPAFLYSKTLLRGAQSAFGGPMHVTDLFPTLLKAAKTPSACLPHDLDGVNQWPQLVQGKRSVRWDMVYDLDNSTGVGAVRRDNYKLVYFREFATQKCVGYFNFPVEENKPRRVDCKEWELYDLDNDPSEENDLSQQLPEKLASLKNLYESALERAVPYVVFVNATASFPENNGGVWQPYGCQN